VHLSPALRPSARRWNATAMELTTDTFGQKVSIAGRVKPSRFMSMSAAPHDDVDIVLRRQFWSRGKPAPGRPFAGRPGLASLLDAGGDGVLRALVKTGEHWVVDLLAGDQVDHHGRSLVAHLERPLADKRGYQAFPGDRHFVGYGVCGDDDEIP